MTHCFDSEVAEKYGIHCAIILYNLFYWIEKNKANETNFHDGKYWTFNSTKAYSKLFPYMTKRQIELAIEKLKSEDLIVTGNYNQSAYDRTTWYAITEKGDALCKNVKCISRGCEMDVTNLHNGNHADVTPIPNINTYINTNNKENISKERFVKPSVSDVASYVHEKNYHVDAQQFYDFYESKGWMVGKNHMKNWKSAVNTWERNYQGNHPTRSVEDEYAGYDRYGFT